MALLNGMVSGGDYPVDVPVRDRIGQALEGLETRRHQLEKELAELEMRTNRVRNDLIVLTDACTGIRQALEPRVEETKAPTYYDR